VSIGTRISKLRRAEKKNSFASKLGITPDYLRMLEVGEKTPGRTLIKLLCMKFAVSEDWLLNGKGDEHSHSIVISPEQSSQVHHINIYTLEELRNKNPKRISTIAVHNPFYIEGMCAIQITNNSMEPSLMENAIAGIDTKTTELIDGNSYVFNIDSVGTIIRRVFKMPEGLTLKADNPIYPNILLKGKYKVYGKVHWVMSTV